MRSFELYEFASYLVPGGILLAATAWLTGLAPTSGLGFVEAGIGLLGAYAAGHVIQAFSRWIDRVLRWPHGPPTHAFWSEDPKRADDVFGESQATQIRDALQRMSWEPGNHHRAEREMLVQRVFARVAADDNLERVSILNANYGLQRGLLGTAVAVALVAAWRWWADGHPLAWTVETTTLALCLVAGALLARQARETSKKYAVQLYAHFLEAGK